jgi:hypothetical protein
MRTRPLVTIKVLTVRRSPGTELAFPPLDGDQDQEPRR